ncbi:DUF6174 domain-containing protein [Dehalogenimonas sp. THU2]|uniref:DUF6174 domain-containing protein n=1 Tax=Dehalogenimonas sp. THU2 TaxID=3151121 RepID=UPI003218B201
MKNINRHLILLFTLSLALVIPMLSGCSPAKDPAQEVLDTNRAKWEQAAIASYDFQLRIGCFCPPDNTRPVDIEVEDGVAISIEYTDEPKTVTTDFFQRADTIEKLFDIIQDAINTEADSLLVEYDATYGHPTSITIDPIKLAVDEEIAYFVEAFAPKA